jgi:hypothetical protein
LAGRAVAAARCATHPGAQGPPGEHQLLGALLLARTAARCGGIHVAAGAGATRQRGWGRAAADQPRRTLQHMARRAVRLRPQGWRRRLRPAPEPRRRVHRKADRGAARREA